jgi:hypothetical protein
MWREEKLCVLAMSLLEEHHCMMTCSKLPSKPLASEQVLERLLLMLLSSCNVKFTLILPLKVN